MKIFSFTTFGAKVSETDENVIVSEPIEGYKQITNVYVEPQTGALVVIHNDE